MENCLKVFSLNCQSLQGKISHIREDKIVMRSDIICLSETWLLSDENHENLQIEGFSLQANGVGRGKGLATYFKRDIFQHCKDIKEQYFQISKLTSQSLDVISIYRSKESKVNALLKEIEQMIQWDQTTLICGDFNICYISDRNNKLLSALVYLGFAQLVQEATHIKGGLIDHVYIRDGRKIAKADCSLYSPYYCAMDHDALLTTINICTDKP